MPQSLLGGPKKPGTATAAKTPVGKAAAPTQSISQKASVKPLASAGKKPPVQATGSDKPPVKFLMSAGAAQQAIQQEEAATQARRDKAGKAFRFWIGRDNLNETVPIIFLDGFLDADGALEPRSWWEHGVKLNGKQQDFICTADVPPEMGGGPCPICAAGNDRHLMFGLTVLDLRRHEIKKGERAGQIIEVSRKLFACKKRTFAQLQVFAQKYHESNDLLGLRGLKFDVTRTGAMTPNVGDNFIVDSYYNDEELIEHFGEEITSPLDIETELVFRSPDELVEMGVAEAVEVVKNPGTSTDFTEEL